jgi:hypothetical protein
MIINNPNDYKFIEFKKSKTKHKKYDAVLMHKKTNKLKVVPFGDARYEQFKDSTGLGIYSHLNNNDSKRRTSYRRRHDGEQHNKYSSGYFAYNYLW